VPHFNMFAPQKAETCRSGHIQRSSPCSSRAAQEKRPCENTKAQTQLIARHSQGDLARNRKDLITFEAGVACTVDLDATQGT
jgi:hypothetical protein